MGKKNKNKKSVQQTPDVSETKKEEEIPVVENGPDLEVNDS
jgi:hypothetical protein